jgi:hypothetical protein
METLLLTDQRPRQTLRRFDVRVPSGYVMPDGSAITQGFTLIVEAGVRWHPEWSEPRVTVNGWRVMALGDALGVAGDDLEVVFGTLLPTEVRALSLYHGKTLTEAGEIAGAALSRLAVASPSAKQALATFILPEQYGRRLN